MARFDTMQAAALTLPGTAEKGRVMTRTITFIAFAAVALAGCEQETIEGGGVYDPMANQVANAVGNVALPPSIVASHQYRCKDNSLISVDWLSDGTTNSARVTPQGGTAASVTQAAGAAEYTAEGATLTGDPKAQSITFNGKSCHL